MANYRHFKHFHDPVMEGSIKLDTGMILRIDSGSITVADAALLSGFSRRSVYKAVSEGEVKSFRSRNDGGKALTMIPWRSFLLWLGGIPFCYSCPLCGESHSLHGLEDLTGRSRCWLLKIIAVHHVRSYYVGMNRRFDRSEFMSAWRYERDSRSKWLPMALVVSSYGISRDELFAAIAKGQIDMKTDGRDILVNRKEMKRYFGKEGYRCRK
jgi:hypothetical protein